MPADYDETAVERVRLFLEDTGLSDADLVDQGRDAAYSATTAAKVAELYKARVSDRMNLAGGSLLIGNDAKAERVAGSLTYEWHGAAAVKRVVEGALGEGAFLGEGYATATHIPAYTDYKFNTAKLKGLAKKMGPAFEEALMDACTVTAGSSRVVFSDKPKAVPNA